MQMPGSSHPEMGVLTLKLAPFDASKIIALARSLLQLYGNTGRMREVHNILSSYDKSTREESDNVKNR